MKEWPSVKDASFSINGKYSGSITQCLLNNQKKGLGFMWKYKSKNYPLKIEKYVFPRIYK